MKTYSTPKVVRYSPFTAPFTPSEPDVYWVDRDLQYAFHDAHVKAFESNALRPEKIEVKEIPVPKGSPYAELFEQYNAFQRRQIEKQKSMKRRYGSAA